MSFKEKLKILEMEPQKSGLLLVSEKETYTNISEVERRMLYIAGDDYNADAVYFKKEEGQTPIVQLFIYDNTDNRLSNEEKVEIHKRIWTSEIVPVYYIIEKTELIVVNGKKKIVIEQDDKDETESKENFAKTIEHKLNFATELEENYDALAHPYKAFFFDNGSFWETETYTSQFLTTKSPFEILINSLKDLKKELIKAGLDEILANRIIVQGILVKYLEEKKDKNGNNIFTVKEDIFEEKFKTKNFTETIKEGKLLEIFDYLSKHYNSKIFEWYSKENYENDKKFIKEEDCYKFKRSVVSEINLRKSLKELSKKERILIANFFDGNYNFTKEQYAIWKYYSFQYLPVELISRIYEEFLPNMSGVAYTPPFLVDFLIDETMPLDEYKKFKNSKFKILDPSLGSGIFCVSAYKRLIDWYKINRFYKTKGKKTWSDPVSPRTLKSILKNNIYGTDIEQEAVKIAIFSLTLALLENLTPIQIFEDLKFDDLSKENILSEDFFKFFNDNKDKADFDLVIGNPPFIRRQLNEIKDFKLETLPNIPGQTSILFLEQVLKLLKKKGLASLIIKASPFLYSNFDYRKNFISKYSIPQIIDFSNLSEELFYEKSVDAIAVFVENKKPTNKNLIWHIIPQKINKINSKNFFSIDHYDFYFVPQQKAVNEKYIWKANLLGGSRLSFMVERLYNIKPTLGEFIENKRKEGWQYGEGYIKGSPKDKTLSLLYRKKRLIKLEENGIYKTQVNTDKYIQYPRNNNKLIFKKPHLIIKENIGKKHIPHTLIEDGDDLVFTDTYIGIHAKIKDIYELKKISNFLKDEKNKILRFLLYTTSSKLLLNRGTVIQKNDIDNLPYPEDEKELELSEVEKVWRDDVLKYYIYQSDVEKNLLNKLIENPEKQLKEYGDVFCLVMNASYGTDPKVKFKQGETIETNSFIATCFHYTDNEIPFSYKKDNEKEFKEHFENQTEKSLKITRIVKFYHENTIWFIKPKQLRYWLKSIGDRDGIDCYGDIINTM